MEEVVVKTLEWLIKLVIRSSGAFLRVKGIGGQLPIVTPNISLNTSDQHFELVNLFIVFEKSSNYVFKD